MLKSTDLMVVGDVENILRHGDVEFAWLVFNLAFGLVFLHSAPFSMF